MMFNDDDDENGLLGMNLPGAQPAPMDDSRMPAAISTAPQAPDVSASAPMNPTVQDYLSKKFNLGQYSPQARQQLVDQQAPDVGDRATAALAAIGAGFQGQNSAAAGQGSLKNSLAQKQQKLANFDQSRQAALESEQTDPTSDASVRLRATLKANFPQIAEKYGDKFDSLTASDSKNVFQVAETKAKLDEAAAKRESVSATKDLTSQMRKDAAGEKARVRASEGDNKDAQNLDKHLSLGWSGRSGQAGVVQGKINAAEAAEALLEQAKSQSGGLDSRQIEELSQSTARLLGGGATASGRVEALVPHTFFGNAQSLKEYLTNHPTGAGLEKFTDRMADTIKREKELAQNQKRQFQIEGLAPYARLKKSNPELYNSILSSKGIDPSMINQKGQYQAPKTIIKTQTNAKTGEKRVVYSDGSTEIMSGNQVAGGDQ